jgi:hypothetical protein
MMMSDVPYQIWHVACGVPDLIVIGSYFAYLFAKVAQSSKTVDVIGTSAAAAAFCL